MGAAHRGMDRAREVEQGNEEARGVGEAIFDGLCTACTTVCSLAFCRFAQHEIANQTGNDNIELQEMPTETQRQAQQAARITAALNPAPGQGPAPVPAPTSLAPIPEEEEEDDAASSPGYTGASPAAPLSTPVIVPLAGPSTITPPFMWQQLPGFPVAAAAPPPSSGPLQAMAITPDPWIPNAEYPLPYGRLQAHGELRRQWIDDPAAPNCPINPSTLTIQQVEANFPYVLPPRCNVMCEDFADQAKDLGIAPGPVYWSLQIRAPNFIWIGDTGPGVIVICAIRRTRNSNAYQISELTQALYTRNFNMNTLRHVFVQQVVNAETNPFVRRGLYTGNTRPGLTWPKQKPETWDYDTPEYDGLLGSRIGKLIAYLVLGAFPRGTRRITRIVTWTADPLNHDRRLHIRFDIEPVPTA